MPPCADDQRAPSRADLAACVEEVLRPAAGAKPAILLARCGDRRVIVKDFSQNGWMMRNLYGRYVVARECRVYRELGGIDGVPAFHGRIDAYAFAIDYIEGSTLKQLGYLYVPPAAFDRLESLFSELHHRGIVHLDAHQKTNVLVDPEGRPYLMDFASSVCVGRGWLARKVLVPFFGRADWRGFVKLKARYCPDALTDGERRRWRLIWATAWLWPPTLIRRLLRRHRKREGPGEEGTAQGGDTAGEGG